MRFIIFAECCIIVIIITHIIVFIVTAFSNIVIGDANMVVIRDIVITASFLFILSASSGLAKLVQHFRQLWSFYGCSRWPKLPVDKNWHAGLDGTKPELLWG